MMMSTASGFFLGMVTAASLTVLYGDRIGNGLGEQFDVQLLESFSAASPLRSGPQSNAGEYPTGTPLASPPISPAVPQAMSEAAADVAGLEQRWAEFAERAEDLEPAGEFPWRYCFQRAERRSSCSRRLSRRSTQSSSVSIS